MTRTVKGARVRGALIAVTACPLEACRPSVTTTRAPAAKREYLSVFEGLCTELSTYVKITSGQPYKIVTMRMILFLLNLTVIFSR